MSKVPGMTQGDIDLVRSTYPALEKKLFSLIRTFYVRFCEQNPEYRLYFQSGNKQVHKLAESFMSIYVGLEFWEVTHQHLLHIGAIHAKYRLTEDHFAKFGESLIWAFQKELPETFTEEVELAWSRLYKVVVGTMLKGMRDAIENEESLPFAA